MGTEIFLFAVILLLCCAVMDLVVGVSNDAVNFLNSSIGSKVTSPMYIMIIASLGIIAGVLFSSGMMEVARKGIFNPAFFTMPELMIIFISVMLTDILLLDIFNTFGLPTSTTVSIVFELLGGAVAASIIKIINNGETISHLLKYINYEKALTIIFGILLSVIVAFITGALFQFFTRLIFSFDYKRYLNSFGALWGGMAMTSIVYFILVKGAGGASFIPEEIILWMKSNTFLLIFIIYVITTILFQILIKAFKIDIFKPVVLVGTFALSMAFAANDLVNFIGVPLAGLQSYKIAMMSSEPLLISMKALSAKVHSETYLLLLSGIIMVLTLWFSKKAKTVTETEIGLGKQDEGFERFESTYASRIIVRFMDSFLRIIKCLIPEHIRDKADKRINPDHFNITDNIEKKASFDFVRAAVNLVVASALISYATSMKLPLSTTYVTFMVAMGSSFSDKAWSSESAVYRVTGVITVISGWFMTALIAFTISFCYANIIHYFDGMGIAGIVLLTAFVFYKTSLKHKHISKENENVHVFSIVEVDQPDKAIYASFDHVRILIHELKVSLDITFESLFKRDRIFLKKERNKVKSFQHMINTIIANVFKILRKLQQTDSTHLFNYSKIIRRLQKLSDAHRDIVARSSIHVSNNHSGFLHDQIDDLKNIKSTLIEILDELEKAIVSKDVHTRNKIQKSLKEKNEKLEKLTHDIDMLQIERIQNNRSKTRLSILYYAIIGNCKVISRQTILLFEIFNTLINSDDKNK